MRYIDEFLGLTTAPLLIQQQLFPNAKEITESMGMYAAVRQYVRPVFNLDYSDKSITVVVIGDGHTPRTAALFATRSRWQAISIDPLLRDKEWKINNLTCISKKIQECSRLTTGKYIIVLPHAHVDIESCLHAIPTPIAIVGMPCCFPMNFKKDSPDYEYYEYHDNSILSPHNMIRIWLDKSQMA